MVMHTGASLLQCTRAHTHVMRSGGDCEDKGSAALVFFNVLIKGPGSMRTQSEWSHSGLKAAASLMRKWYRPMLIIWAVNAPSLQGAAAASAGEGFACHINCCLLPKCVLQPSPADQVQLKADEFASCQAPFDLPPLVLEGTGVTFCA